MAARSPCLQRASDPALRREPVVAPLLPLRISPMEESNTISLYSGGHLDNRCRSSARGKPRDHQCPLKGSQATLHLHNRCVSASCRVGMRPSVYLHPKAPTDFGSNERTCHDHVVWSERQTIHQRATTGATRRRLTGVSQQESKTPSRGSLPFGGIRYADR